MNYYLKNMFIFVSFIFLFKVSQALAASGPLAKGFGADDWLDKIYVVITVFGIVVFTTATLIFFILRKKD